MCWYVTEKIYHIKYYKLIKTHTSYIYIYIYIYVINIYIRMCMYVCVKIHTAIWPQPVFVNDRKMIVNA